jgi:DNA primase
MSQQFIDFGHVKEHASFERVLSHYSLALTGKGVQRAVLCPFHRERRPSCKVELEKKIFHCFGCGKKGNVLEFVAEIDKTDLRAAALKIASICDIPAAPPRGSSGTAAERPRRSTPAPAAKATPNTDPKEVDGAKPGLINPPLTFELKLDAQHPYLADRGLSAALVALFGLGYCARGLMKGRVCIPIHDSDGNLIAYSGRWVDVGEPPEGEDKYKLPAKFQKSRVLYNLHRVENPEHVVLVEGFWSAIRLHALGVPVMALMGWSISAEQVALLLRRGVRSVVVLLDGDDAGYQARERVVPPLAEQFFVSAPKLPAGMKPDILDEADLLSFVAAPVP